MRIVSYIQLNRTTIDGTGVVKHVTHMTRGLAATAGVQLSLLAPQRELDADGQLPAWSTLRGLPVTGLRLSRRMLEKLWFLTGHPLVDGYCPPSGVDWIYCPADTFVPSRKFPLALTLHGMHRFDPSMPLYNTWPYRRFRLKWKYKMPQVLKHARLILVVSEFLKKQLCELFPFDPKKMVVVYNGAEDVFFDAGKRSDLPAHDNGGRPYVLAVQGLLQVKGAEYLLAVAGELQKIAPDLQILTIGQYDPPFDELARSLPNIVQLPFANAETLMSMMRGAIAVLHLSRYDSFGISTVEAMAVGTPVMVSRFGALSEVVADAGIVADVAKPAEIARNVVDLRNSQPLRERFIMAGKQRAQHFTWAECVKRLHVALQSS